MKTKKTIFILILGLVFVFLVNFKHIRKSTINQKDSVDQLNKIQTFNSGLPFKLKEQKFAPDQILVKFKPTLSDPFVEATISAYQSKRIKRIPKLNIYQIQIPESMTVEEMLFILNQNPDVEYAEPNYRAYIAVTPNDTFFKYQYALYNKGQEIGQIPGDPKGKPRSDIKATESWEETKGNESVLIAIIDTGIDFDHPDLKNKIYSSGYDFANEDSDATDDHGHGTHVSGIASADTNNSEGMAGVAWNCKILPIKVMDEEGSGYYSWIIDAIRWAADNGASVINLSLGGDESSKALEEALQYAYERDVVIIAAAGNEAGSVIYPAAYDAYCIAVAASDYNDSRTEWSNHGPEIDVAAPGERILSCVPIWYWEDSPFPYGYGFGTSMAAPHVSGLAALIKSIKPWLKASEIMNVIRYTADDVNADAYPGKDEYIGYGRINMEKALVPIKISGAK